jgi:hypothetical protein
MDCCGRVDCENRFKELKYDFGAKIFTIDCLLDTEVALLTIMLA